MFEPKKSKLYADSKVSRMSSNPFGTEGAAKSSSPPSWVSSTITRPKELSVSLGATDPRVPKCKK